MNQVLILNGAPSGTYTLDNRVSQLLQALQQREISADQVVLRELSIRHCTGCWSCWVKTPGECIHRDDAADVLRRILQADLLLMASPLLMGYPSAVLKRFMDRMIPLVHPYIQWDRGECHHQARYAHYPQMGLYLEKESDTDADDMEIVCDLMSRAARNMKTSLLFTHTLEDNLDEVCDEINRL